MKTLKSVKQMRTLKRRPRDEYLDVNGLRLHYLDWGKNSQKTMLLLHGFMAHAHVWDEFVSGFRNRYHIIALDQRGHGDSQWSEDEAYSLDDHFSDIANFIEVLELKDLIFPLLEGLPPTQALNRLHSKFPQKRRKKHLLPKAIFDKPEIETRYLFLNSIWYCYRLDRPL